MGPLIEKLKLIKGNLNLSTAAFEESKPYAACQLNICLLEIQVESNLFRFQTIKKKQFLHRSLIIATATKIADF